MKKVILLGDSIRLIGYGARTAELLGPDYTVWQPEDNCRFASYTLRMLFEYKDQLEGADVIHWNNGLWDVCDLFGDGAFTPLEDYIRLLARIAAVLKTYSKKVIFATTTPPSPTCGVTISTACGSTTKPLWLPWSLWASSSTTSSPPWHPISPP